MKLRDAPHELHLTYCTNIHAGESWSEVKESLRESLVPIRQSATTAPFGVGLRLSAAAAAELEENGELAWLREFFSDHRLYLVTINGFPYGAFHGERVKENVYLPDWSDDRRLAYADRLARIAAAMFDASMIEEISISTVPCGLRRSGSAEWLERVLLRIVSHAAYLVELERRHGSRLTLALEPEPGCWLESTDDVTAFFELLFSRRWVQYLAGLTGTTAACSEEFLRRAIGICLDTCHAAVGWEDPDALLDALAARGIRVAKAQISAGLEFDSDGSREREALSPFVNDVYLHQVTVVGPEGVRRSYLDLPEALDRATDEFSPAEIWRIHFHVPLFLEELGGLRTTQAVTRRFLRALLVRNATSHLEVETYAWNVLPEALRGDVVTNVSRELAWTLNEIQS